jgi:hypothetical protein
MLILFLELKLMMTKMKTNRPQLFLVLTALLSIGVDVVFVFGFDVGVVVFGVPLQNETSQWSFSFKVL